MTPPTGTGTSTAAAAAAAAAAGAGAAGAGAAGGPGGQTPLPPIRSVANNFYNEMTTVGIGITTISGVAGIISAARGSTTGVVVSALGIATGTVIALTGNQEQARRMAPVIEMNDILTLLHASGTSGASGTSSSTASSSSAGQQDESRDETDLD